MHSPPRALALSALICLGLVALVTATSAQTYKGYPIPNQSIQGDKEGNVYRQGTWWLREDEEGENKKLKLKYCRTVYYSKVDGWKWYCSKYAPVVDHGFDDMDDAHLAGRDPSQLSFTLISKGKQPIITTCFFRPGAIFEKRSPRCKSLTHLE